MELHFVDSFDAALATRTHPGRLPGPGVTRLAHLSDLHLGKPRAEGPQRHDLLDVWMRELPPLGVDAFVVTGDIVEVPDDRPWMERARATFEASGLPWTVIPGNHDIAHPGQVGPFHDIFGDYPRLSPLVGLDILHFDSFGAYPEDQRSEAEHRHAREHGAFEKGRIDSAQLENMGALLGPETAPRIALVHHHLFDDEDPNADESSWFEPCKGADSLIDFCRANAVQAVLFGHKHRQMALRRSGELLLVAGGSSVNTEHCRVRLLDFDAEGLCALHTLELQAAL